jgi:dihydroorotase
MKEQILLNRPFDAHMHWRQPGLLEQVAPYSMNQFAGGLVMPNTNPKILSLPQLLWYRKAVLGFLKEVQSDFFTLFTYYLSAELSEDDLREAWSQKLIHAVKYYPKGGTTASDKGLTGFREVYPLLAVMEELGIPLLIHGETPEIDGMVVDDFQREQVFMETELVDLVHAFPGLRIVLEHITTEAAANFVLAHANVYATITPQHCLLDRRALFNGSFMSGLLIMLAFALGTLPMLALLSFGSASFAHSKHAPLFFKSAGVIVVGLGIFSLLAGLAGLGIIQPIFNI